ncbi:MAG TPA: TonB family protein [Paraburkholderia sp.]
MNSRIRFRAAFDDSPGVRIALALLAALLIWLVFLGKLGRWLGAAAALQPVAKPLDVQIVELAPPVPLAPPAASVANRVPLKPRVQARPLVLPQHVVPHSSPQKILQSAHSAGPAQPAPALAEAKPSNEPAPRSAPPDESPKPPVTASGDSAARPLAQPLPDLPDDLREQAYQTQATARFLIHADGSTEVELIKPTPNPRLNQILLTALHQWRFFPAMQSGHPVESQLDIRVHFNVD